MWFFDTVKDAIGWAITYLKWEQEVSTTDKLTPEALARLTPEQKAPVISNPGKEEFGVGVADLTPSKLIQETGKELVNLWAGAINFWLNAVDKLEIDKALNFWGGEMPDTFRIPKPFKDTTGLVSIAGGIAQASSDVIDQAALAESNYVRTGLQWAIDRWGFWWGTAQVVAGVNDFAIGALSTIPNIYTKPFEIANDLQNQDNSEAITDAMGYISGRLYKAPLQRAFGGTSKAMLAAESAVNPKLASADLSKSADCL